MIRGWPVLRAAPARPSRHVRSMSSVTERDWYTWHHDYDEPGSALAQRLAAVAGPNPRWRWTRRRRVRQTG